MSPPKLIPQQGLQATADSLDGDSPRKNQTLENFSVVDRKKGAVEQEDGPRQFLIREEVSVKKDTKSGVQPPEDTKETFKNDVLQLVDLPDDTHTPDCLNKDDVEDFNDDHQSSLKNRVSHDDQPSLNKVKLQRSKRSSKRKKQPKVYSRKKTKKQKIIHCGQNECCRTVGGGEKTCTTGSGLNGATTAATKSSVTGTAIGNHGCQGVGGGGGGDGGEDGDGPGRDKKLLKQDCSFKTVSPKKKSSSDEMEVVENGGSSFDSPMDVDPRSSEKQAVDMGAGHDPHDARREEKPSPPDRKPPTKLADRPMPTLKFLLFWHCRINHHHYCKNSDNCDSCRWACNPDFFHVTAGWGHGCACQNCSNWSAILKFHKTKCKISDCCICIKFKQVADGSDEKLSSVKEDVVQRKQKVAVNVQNVQHDQHDGQNILNTPTSAASLDATNEEVIYNDDMLKDLTHFREHESFSFKKSEIVGKGGNGEVYDVVLHDELTKKYCCLANKNFVVKKATVQEEELKALKHMATHPNFVKTFLVSNRIDGRFKQLILMEKCDTSLLEYLQKMKGLGLYEAMHYWTQVLDAVVYLHNHLHIPIIHKDIKSSNVLLTFETNLVRVKLADYDSIKFLHNEYTMPGLPRKGTKYFIAPEVDQMRAHGRPADVYSLGMFLLEILFGKLMKKPEVAIEKLRKIDPELADLITSCIKYKQEERPTALQIQQSPAVLKYLKKDFTLQG